MATVGNLDCLGMENKKILTEAYDALGKVLKIEDKIENEEEVKGMSDFVPEAKLKIVPKVKAKVKIVARKSVTESDITKRILQDINKISNKGLADIKRVGASN